MIVHKFGGTSVGDARRFENVAEIVIAHNGGAELRRPSNVVVVVSAMSGVTDQLVAGARAASRGEVGLAAEIKDGLLKRHLEVVESVLPSGQERRKLRDMVHERLQELARLYSSIAVLGELTSRGSDAISSFGERLSAPILAAVLRQRGQKAEAVSATQLIVTDENFGAAAPRMEPTRERLIKRVKPLIERGVIPVITGFIAATEEGVVSTLGRGGSDFAASIVGAGLDADEVWIWSDVDGILTADPNIVAQARTLEELSYVEAADLAYIGAEVLHPKTIGPLVERGIPLRIVNSFNPSHPGTLIVEKPSEDRSLLPAIISATGLSLIAVGSRDDSWTLSVAALVLQRLGESGVEVLMFSQSFSERSLNLVVSDQDKVHCLNTLRSEIENNQHGVAWSLEAKEKVATVSVVGVPDWNANGIVSRVFSALGGSGTRVIAVAQAANEYSVSCCIPEEQVEGTVRFLHHALGLEKEGS